MVAQFKAATIAETTYQKNPGPTPVHGNVAVNNDILIRTIANVKHELTVTVWTGLHAGMGWNFVIGANTYSNIYDLPSNTYEADVSILEFDNNGLNDWYVVIAYTKAPDSYPMRRILKFNMSTFQWDFISDVNLGTNKWASYIHIDSDQRDHYFIVWNQNNAVNQQTIYGASGGLVNGVLKQCLINYEFPQFKHPNGVDNVNYPYSNADVAVMDLPSNNQSPGQVRISFKGSQCSAFPPLTHNQTICVTNEIQFTMGNCGLPAINTSLDYIKPNFDASPGYYNSPRIGRHRRDINVPGLQNGYTVVYDRYDESANKYDICGTTVFYDQNQVKSTTENVYTDGFCQFYNTANNYLPDINDGIANRFPVISYEKKSGSNDPLAPQNMIIAFNTSGPVYDGPVAFYAHNSDGKPYTTSGNYEYYKVPYNLASNDFGIYTAVSGEQSEKFLISFTHYNSQVNYKLVTSMSDLRNGLFENGTQELISSVIVTDYMNPDVFDELSNQLILVDSQGKLLATSKAELKNILPGLSKGISFLKYQASTGSYQTLKLLKL